MANVSTPERIRLVAELLVRERTNGLCPLDGPCSLCDCFDPEHRQERELAARIVQVLS